MGKVVPSPSSSSASEETTASAGRSSLSAPATSPTVAANKTSCPNPISVCASPSSRATSVPTRITFATTEFPSLSQVLNRLKLDPAHLDHFGSRGETGYDAHIAPRRKAHRIAAAARVETAHISRKMTDSMTLRRMYATIGVMSSPPRTGTTRRRGCRSGSLSR